MSTAPHQVDVCIAGGGPAGLTLALLLARHGIRTLVLEHAPDFAREYRGEVLMPRFAQCFEQVGLAGVVANLPHQRLARMFLDANDRPLAVVRLEDVSPTHPYATWVPQPALLGALHEKGRTLPHYDLWFEASARELIREGDRIVGVRVKRGDAHEDVRARVVVAADGRYSRMRKVAAIPLELDAYEFDVIWFDLPRPPGDSGTFRVWLTPVRNFLMLPKHPDLFQCGMITEPGGLPGYRARGLEAIRADLMAGPERLHAFARGLEDWSPFHPLEARIGLAETWARDGFLLVGDAAHTCSPAGAIGVSVAIETAIVAADVIRRAHGANDYSAARLAEVERLRKPEVLGLLKRQRQFGRLFAQPPGWRRPLAAFGARVVARAGLLPWAFRGLAVRKGPLPVASDLGF